MTVDEKGNVTFTKEEYKLVKKFFLKLHEILNDQPTFIGDYLTSRKEYLDLERARCLVANKPFVKEDYE